MIVAVDLESGEQHTVTEGTRPDYSPAGYLVYSPSRASNEGVWAMPFSLDTLRADGDEFMLSATGSEPSFSAEGTVVYRDATTPEMGMKTLVWRNRRGEAVETVGRPQPGIREFSLSPDRRFAATTVDEPCDVWIQDLNRSSIRKLTHDEACEYLPTWSPAGDQVAYTLGSGSGTPSRIMLTEAVGVDEPSVLIETENPTRYASWTRDGRYLVFQEEAGPNNSDIRYLHTRGDGARPKAKTFLGAADNETVPAVSPDGKFMAYVSDETGRNQVYVRPFPGGGRPRQVSANGGAQPRWRDDGAELFYVESSDTLVAVSFSVDEEPAFGKPQRLFQSADFNFRRQPWPLYEVSADGQRILTATSVYADVSATIRIVENWHQEYLRRSGGDAPRR